MIGAALRVVVSGALLLFAAGAGAQEAPAPVALVGATLVDGTGGAPLPNAALVIRAGRIACVGTRAACPVPPGVETRDLSGRWIIPGLVDGHVHYSQTGWSDGRPDQGDDLRADYPYAAAIAKNRSDPDRWYRAYLCSGVTATWDVGGYPWTWDLRADTERRTDAPHVAAAGPLISARDHWINTPGEKQLIFMSSAAAVDTTAMFLIANRTDAVKVWYLVAEDTPGRDSFSEMLRVAARRAAAANIPLIVHATTLWAAKDALAAGAKHLVHSVDDKPVDAEFIRMALANGTSYNPTLVVSPNVLQYHTRAFDERVQPLACVDPETRGKVEATRAMPRRRTDAQLEAAAAGRIRAREIMFGNLRRVHEAGIPVVMGTDAGNTFTLHGTSVNQEMESMQAAGLSPMDVLVASTRNGARAMGRGADFGTLERGKLADLVVLTADPTADIANVRRIEAVMRGGQLHERRALELAAGR
jgi:imidazolonepropionase-like amidohydrolase